MKDYRDKISSENEELCRRRYVRGDLNAFDKITEPRELIEINGLLSQVSHDNEPEACISGIELRVEKLENQAFILAQKRQLLLLFENLIYYAISFYIARITVEELGGSIHAESVKGQGSVFTVRIPLAGTVPSL